MVISLNNTGKQQEVERPSHTCRPLLAGHSRAFSMPYQRTLTGACCECSFDSKLLSKINAPDGKRFVFDAFCTM